MKPENIIPRHRPVFPVFEFFQNYGSISSSLLKSSLLSDLVADKWIITSLNENFLDLNSCMEGLINPECRFIFMKITEKRSLSSACVASHFPPAGGLCVLVTRLYSHH